MKRAMIVCLLLAFIAAAVYVLLETNVITIPAGSAEDGPKWFGYIMGGCYVLGGLLILAGNRWLWTIGLVLNTLIIGVFFLMYNQKPDIMWSLPGLGTKIAQVLLEFGLLYLIFKNPGKTRQARKSLR
jgi:hypothetical protein